MKRIDEDIKNKTFRKCYLLYGKEAYLKQQYRNKLLAAMVQPGDNLNFSAYEGEGIDPRKLIDLAETLPFFAERRVILVEDSGFFTTACDVLADYLPQAGDATCFLFVEPDADKRSRMYKAADKSGVAVDFAKLDEATLTKWILGRIQKEQKKITKQVLTLFLSRTGDEMGIIDRELEKLFCLTLHKDTIEASDVEAVVTAQLQDRVFVLTDAIFEKNRKKALELYADLLELRKSPLAILFLITRQLRIVASVRELSQKGYGNSEIAKQAGVPPFAVRKYQGMARHFTARRLACVLEEAASLEEDVKAGRLQENLAVELLMIRMDAFMT